MCIRLPECTVHLVDHSYSAGGEPFPQLVTSYAIGHHGSWLTWRTSLGKGCLPAVMSSKNFAKWERGNLGSSLITLIYGYIDGYSRVELVKLAMPIMVPLASGWDGGTS
jgi:hypothetical protein